METMQQSTPLHILLADDDKDDRYFFEKALKEIPIATTLTTVKDGEELMDYLSKNSEDFPHALFLDLNMPRKKGGECLSEIKLNPKLKELPVIIYSTSLHDALADELYKNGAHYYLHKQDFEELVKSLQQVLSLLVESANRPPRDKFIVNGIPIKNKQ